MKGTEFTIGHLQSQNVSEIWNGEAIRKWRREFLEGNPQSCKTEIRHHRCHTCPEYNALLHLTDPKEIQTAGPKRITLNLNGKCNLECRMCHVWREPNGLYETEGWWDQVKPLLAGAEEIELLSGEPFIQRDTYRLIDEISALNPGCRWSITSNGHWKFTATIESALNKIVFKNLILSIDSLDPDTYPKIRRRGKLDVVLANFEELLRYEKDRLARGLGSLNLRVTFVVQQDNWRELAAFHAFSRRHSVPVTLIFLYEPLQYSLLALPEEERATILEFYLNTLTPHDLNLSRRVTLPLLDSLSPLSRAEFLLKMRDATAARGSHAEATRA